VWFIIVGLAVSLVGPPPVVGQSIPVGTFRLVAVHPEAAAYPSLGDSLVGLTPWKGRLYTGYGHWLEFTGILDFPIRAYDPASNQLLSQWITDAEAVWNYRAIGSKLYAPLTDPTSENDYALGEPWQDRDVVVGTKRMFDVATLNGTDLFMVGSTGADAVAWRSTDGGQTWQESLRVPKQDPLDSETHFNFAIVVGGKVYVQAFGIGHSGTHPTSKVFDGTNWSNGPNLLPDSLSKGWKPVPYAGKVVYLSGDPQNPSTGLLTFDGVEATEVQTPFRVWDFFVSGSYLYALVVDPSAPSWAPVVRRTSDLLTWTDVAVPPVYSRSISVLNGYLYVGATEGRLFKYSEPVRRCRQPSRRLSLCRRYEG
jgi:hypothetical protein